MGQPVGEPERFLWRDDSGPEREYAPLDDEPTLFHTFSEVTPTEEGVLDFANRYGWLGGPGTSILLPATDDPPNWTVARGESLTLWDQEIRALGMAQTIWTYADTGADHLLRDYIRWDGTDHVVLETDQTVIPRRYAVIASKLPQPKLLATFEPGDLIEPAKRFVISEANERLSKHVHARLLHRPGDSRERFHQVPSNLLGAIWLQFALEVAGVTTIRACAMCRTYFAIEPPGKKTRRFCGVGCRVANHRRKQRPKERTGSS